jgi:hypothetical protein
MRDYAIVPTKFWITPLAKSLRGDPAAQVIALYLKTGPHANMIGLYHCPIAYIAQDTGIPFEGASKALASLAEAGYCTFDDQADVVFVRDMAPEQIGSALALADKRTKAVFREWSAVPSDDLRRAFHRLYSEAFHLPPMHGIGDLGQEPLKPLANPFEVPLKAPQSQEQEQEQETDQEQDSDAGVATPSKKGTRLSSDWALPKVWGDWAMAEFPAWTADTVRTEAAKFRDYWTSKSGKDATKLDWQATWRNWCRNARIASPGRPGAMTDEQRAAAGSASTAEAMKLLGFTDASKGEVINAPA